MNTHKSRKPVVFIGSALKDLKALPGEVQDMIGRELLAVQHGEMPYCGKALRGFGHAGIFEIIVEYAKDSYRTVFTVDFSEAVYVLHAFQKKSKHGISTPQREIALIRTRYKRVQEQQNRHE